MASKLSFRSHIFLCVSEKAKCASREALDVSWSHLKNRVAAMKLNTKVGRTQANCLQICQKGPVAVVFDKNGSTWYGKCEPDVLDLILDQHCLGGKVVKEHQIAENTAFFLDSVEP